MAAIDVLSLDDLLIIFNFLTLFDKLAAMRVCQKWYSIMNDTHAWKVINFNDKGTNNGDFFPADESKVVNFLETFAGVGLQEVYLSVVSEKIMTTLRNKCPNLDTLSFLKAKTPGSKMFEWDTQIVREDKLYIPPRLRRLEMSSPPRTREQRLFVEYQNVRKSREEKIFSLLSQCPNLKYISLKGFLISEASFQKFIENVSLKEMDLIQPHVEEAAEKITRIDYFPSTSTVVDDVLTAAAAFMNSLQHFRLDCYRELERHIYVLEKMPSCISHWANLKVLALRGVRCSDESFAIMIPSLLNINSLELEGPIVTSNIISIVGKNLKKILFLELGNGYYSDESLESLANHPSLERLWIHKEYSNQRELPPTCSWLHAIYSVLVTLPRIKRVKMEGYRLICLHSRESFPVVESAEIQICNVFEGIPDD